MKWIQQTPWWVWAITLLFALLQPFTHWMVLAGAPPDAVPTGLHKPDSAVFIHTMRMFESGFYSPYATCRSPFGDHSPRLFATPFYLLYGLAGLIGSALPISDFMLLAWANAFGAACYLLAAYHFMRAIHPIRSSLAFVLFALSGGIGGPLYLACSMLGVADTPAFSAWFYRFAIYDLVEGPNLAPYLLMPRLYYTLPLALALSGFTACIVAWRVRCRAHLLYASALLFTGVLLNARLGPPIAAIAGLYLAQHADRPFRRWIVFAAPLAAAMAVAALVMRLNPGFVANTLAAVRQGMWFTSYLSAAFPLLLAAAPQVLRQTPELSRPFRLAAAGSLGYLAVFSALFVAHQLYYGTLHIGADHAASVQISDFALIGAAAGVVLAWRSRAEFPRPNQGWLVVWALLFSALAVSAFGRGWFLQFSPQRLMVFLGVPLSLLAAETIQSLWNPRRYLAATSLGFAVVCGISSLVVSTLVFQGPLGMRPGLASDIGMHAAYVPLPDARCLDALGPGTVAAPPPYNDILSLRNGVHVLGGYGAVSLSDQGATTLDAAVDAFFDPDVPNESRRNFLREWCVTHVYVPGDFRENSALADHFDHFDALELVAASGPARLYAVRMKKP